MTPLEAINGAYALLPGRMDTPAATVLLLAIQYQEDPQRLQKQVGGPARGLWQFEKGGGVTGVLTHPASRGFALSVCLELGVTPTTASIMAALERGDDRLDAALARLLLWTESAPLPAIGEVSTAWEYYLHVWRPGAAKRDAEGLRKKWSVNYARALDTLRAG